MLHKLSLHPSLVMQIRVIGALVLREARATFGSSQLGYLWAILVPTIGTLFLVAIFSVAGRLPPYGTSFAMFFASGMMVLQMFTKLSDSLMNVFDANKALLTYPPIKGTDVLFARTILICATYILIIFVFFSILICLDWADLPSHLGEVLAALAVTTLFGFGFGATNACLLTLWDSWKHIKNILMKPLFFISGIFYVPSYMPQDVIKYLRWNPALHLIEWFRNGYYPNYDSLVLDKTFVLSISVIFVFTGLVGEVLTRKSRG